MLSLLTFHNQLCRTYRFVYRSDDLNLFCPPVCQPSQWYMTFRYCWFLLSPGGSRAVAFGGRNRLPFELLPDWWCLDESEQVENHQHLTALEFERAVQLTITAFQSQPCSHTWRATVSPCYHGSWQPWIKPPSSPSYLFNITIDYRQL
jgi:hypothetical protein